MKFFVGFVDGPLTSWEQIAIGLIVVACIVLALSGERR